MLKKQQDVVSHFLQAKQTRKHSSPIISASNRLLGEAVLRSMELDGEFYGQNRRPITSRDERQSGFEKVISNAYGDQPSRPASSKIAHSLVGEAIIDLLSNIILRPLPVLLATFFGFLLCLAYYLFAYFNNQSFYFQTIIASCLIGYLLGWIIDLFYLFKRRK